MTGQDVAVLDGCLLVISDVSDYALDFLDADRGVSLLLVSGLHASAVDLNDNYSKHLNYQIKSIH